jgi:hypothetical protein
VSIRWQSEINKPGDLSNLFVAPKPKNWSILTNILDCLIPYILLVLVFSTQLHGVFYYYYYWKKFYNSYVWHKNIQMLYKKALGGCYKTMQWKWVYTPKNMKKESMFRPWWTLLMDEWLKECTPWLFFLWNTPILANFVTSLLNPFTADCRVHSPKIYYIASCQLSSRLNEIVFLVSVAVRRWSSGVLIGSCFE